MGRANLSRNPSCAVDTSNWVGGTGWTRITGQTVASTGKTTAGRVTVGTGSYPDVGSVGTISASNAAAGRAISYVAWVRSSVARNLDHGLSKYNGASFQSFAVNSTRVALSANTWTLIRGTGTVSSGGTYDKIGVHLDLPTGASGTLDAAAVRIELDVTDSTMTFADGDTSGWVWDGTAGSSTSQEATGAVVQASAALSGSGTLTAAGGRAAAVSAPLSGSGTIAAGASQGQQAAAALSGAGSLAGAATQGRQAAAALSGAGTLSAAGTRVQPVSAALSGAGSLTAALRQGQQAAAALTGIGTLAAQAGQTASAALTGTGALAAAARQTHGTTAALSGSGALAVGAVRQDQRARAALTGAGSLTTTGTRVQPAAAALSGSGVLTVTGTRVKVTGAQLTGTGSLSVGSVLRTAVVAAALAGAGTLIARAKTSAGGMLNPSLWAKDPVTGRLVPLPHVLDLKVSDIASGVGAISCEYPAWGLRSDLLRAYVTDERDLEVEVWTEGRRATRQVGWLKNRQGDSVAERAVWSFTGVLVTGLLDEAIILPQPADEKGEFRVAAATPGALFRTLVLQAQAVGALAGVTMDFTATHDSSGVAWPEVITRKWSPGTTLLAVATQLVELGLVEFTITPDRVLRLWRFGGRGTNRSAGARPTTFRRGVHLLEAGRRQGVDDSGTDFLVIGGEGQYATAADPAARARRGRVIQRASSVGTIDDPSALNAAAQRTRASGVRGPDEQTFSLALGVGMPRPGPELGVGDTVRVDTSGTLAPLRLAQWDVTYGPGGVAAQIVTGDLIRSRAAALAKRIADQASGETVIGTSEPTKDTGIPLAPTGLVVGSEGITEGSDVYSVVTGGWAPVLSNVDGTSATDLDSYRVEWALETAPTKWNLGADVDASRTSGAFTVAPDTPIRVRVRARDRSGNAGAWSTEVSHITQAVLSPPGIPSALTGTNWLGGLRWEWDGKTADGADMLLAYPRFDHVELWMGVSAAFADATLVTDLRDRGRWTIAGLPYGVGQYAWLVAVDRQSNRSDPSAVATATPRKLVDLDFGPGSVDRAAIKNLAVGTLQLDNGAVNSLKVSELSVALLTGGTMSADVIIGGNFMTATSGRRVRIGNDGVLLYNSNGEAVTALRTADASALITGQIQTALTGTRMVMNWGNANPAEMRFYPASTNQYASMGPVTSVATGYEGQAGINMKAWSSRTDKQSGEVGVFPSYASLVWGNERGDGAITARIAVSQAENFYGGARHRMVATQDTGDTFYGFFSVGGDNGGNWSSNPSVLSFAAANGGTGNARLRNFDRNSGLQFDTGIISVLQTNGSPARFQAATHEVSSSGKWKTAVADLPFDPLTIVRAVKARQYERTDDPRPGTKRIGLIAEDLPSALTVDMTQGRGLGVDLYALISAVWDATRVIGDRLTAIENAPTLRPFLAPR